MTMNARYPGTCAVCGKRFPAGTAIDYDRATRETRHVTCQPVVLPPNAIRVSCGEGYGGVPYTVGDVIPNPHHRRDPQAPEYLTVLKATQEYFADDGMSFGVGDDAGYLYAAACRPATDEESAPLRALAAEAQQRDSAKARVAQIARHIQTDGTFAPADTPFPAGTLLLDTRTIHGTGSVFVVAADGVTVWYLDQHGMDGDDWSANNVRGQHRGWYLADPALAQDLRALAAQLGKKEA